MTYYFAYVTCPSLEEAQRIGRGAVEKKLAACANILPEMHSIYHWGGKIEDAKECVLILKTKESLFGKLRDFVLETHSNDCPCVVALPIKEGSPAYFQWMENSLK